MMSIEKLYVLNTCSIEMSQRLNYKIKFTYVCEVCPREEVRRVTVKIS